MRGELHMIKTKSLTKTYNIGGGSVVALDGITMSVKKGEFAAITGASGSGKSTLMNILGCLDSATDGAYTLDGADVSFLSGNELSEIRNRKIAFIFQSFNLIKTLTALENVILPLAYRGIPYAERAARGEAALAKVGLSMRAEHRPYQLSGGQQQRVAIARAIAADTPVILADEPCGNLDSRTGKAVMEMLAEQHRLGKTILLITHDENAAKYADRVIRISDGKIAQ